MAEKIGLIGLGLVGTAIAESLLAKQFSVIGFDIDSERCRQIEKLGARVASSPAVVAGQTKRVVLSLPDTEAVQQVIEGPKGLLEGSRKTGSQAKSLPTYVIDTTTGDPEETMALARRLAERHILLLDSTISGSSQQVRERKAVFMVGGEKEAFDRCMDIFTALTDRVFYIGPSGSGSKAKLASNLVLGLNRLVLAEGLVFAGKLGLELKGFLELLKATPAYSAVMDTKGDRMLNGDFIAEARIRQHHKDVLLILKYAEKAGQELPLSKVHLDILEKAITAGEADFDNSAVIREIQRRQRHP